MMLEKMCLYSLKQTNKCRFSCLIHTSAVDNIVTQSLLVEKSEESDHFC